MGGAIYFASFSNKFLRFIGESFEFSNNQAPNGTGGFLHVSKMSEVKIEA